MKNRPRETGRALAQARPALVLLAVLPLAYMHLRRHEQLGAGETATDAPEFRSVRADYLRPVADDTDAARDGAEHDAGARLDARPAGSQEPVASRTMTTAKKDWRQEFGRALAQARPALALLAVLPLAFLGGYCFARGGYARLGVVPCALLGVMALREVGRFGPRRLVNAFGNALLLLAVVGFWALALGPRFAGYETMTVLSTSMTPTFNPGDIILVTRQPAASVRAGQIISFHIPTGDHHVVTHRIATVVMRGGHPVVQTKGDANSIADPWRARLEGSSVWRYRLRVPFVGYPLLYLREPPVRVATLYGAPTLLVLLLLGRIWLPGTFRRALRRPQHAPL